MKKKYEVLNENILAVQNKQLLLKNFYLENENECLDFLQDHINNNQVKPILLTLLLNIFQNNSEPQNTILKNLIHKIPNKELTYSNLLNSPLYTVCSKNYLPLIKEILSKDINVNCIDSIAKENPICPLILSKKIPHTDKEELIKLFIDKGLDIYNLDEIHSSLLHLCSKSEDIILLEKMLPFQTDYNVCDDLHNTFVDYLAHYAKFEDFIKFADLIKNPDPKNNFVHSLAVMGRKRMLEFYAHDEKLFTPGFSGNNPNEKLQHYLHEKKKVELNIQ